MYHYTQCGLDNVWLENGYEIKSTPYGKASAVHDVDGLHALLAAKLVEKHGALTGKEFRFLRAWLSMTQEALAQMMGVTEGALSLWERKDAVPSLNEKMLRLMVLARTDGNATVHDAVERINTMHKLVNQKYVVSEHDHRREVRVLPARRAAKVAIPA
ncbi:MAG TPA: helix-turn-helix domain-containing protein [Burkholderiaceae bacterium]